MRNILISMTAALYSIRKFGLFFLIMIVITTLFSVKEATYLLQNGNYLFSEHVFFNAFGFVVIVPLTFLGLVSCFFFLKFSLINLKIVKKLNFN